MEGGRREGEWWRGEGGRGSDGGQKEGGRVMQGRRREGSGGGERWRGREWCEVRSEEEQKCTYHSSSSLASAHVCWPSLSGRSSSFSCGRLVGGHLCSWAFISICPCLFPFTGMHFHWWASAFVGGRSCSCGGEVESWWLFVMEGLVAWLLRRVMVLHCCL